MPGPRDWQGVRQGKLLVIRRLGSRLDGQATWECRCDCGTLCIKSSGSLGKGTKSCSHACGITESNRRRAVTGVAHGKEWRAWQAAKQRCANPKNPGYKNYGARGLSMWAGWLNDFPAFYRYIGPAPDSGRRTSIDRIDNDRGYEPGNVRWTTTKAQLNNRRITRMVQLPDRSIALTDAAVEFGLPYCTLDGRWRRGVRGQDLLLPRKRVLNRPGS